MKEFIDTKPELKNIIDFCKQELASFEGNPDSIKDNIAGPTKKRIELSPHRAARVIQRFWRLAKVKEALNADSYHTYLSLVGPEEVQQSTSAIMFGLHIAELSPQSKDRTSSPFLNKKRHYHRQDVMEGALFEHLLLEFNITTDDREQNDYIPVSLLRSISIEEIVCRYAPQERPLPKLIKEGKRSVGLLALPKVNNADKKIRHILEATGVIASLWEIAENITHQKYTVAKTASISLNPTFPRTIGELLKSHPVMRLHSIADHHRYPTHHLATCLRNILHNLPKLTPKAIQRIALMLDITTTFYAYHYQQFAFCIYTVVHEISLSFLKQTQPDQLEKNYCDFFKESNATLLKTLSFNEETVGDRNFVVAFPAISGTNAYALAIHLALTMKPAFGEKPTIKVVKPSYYEFNAITQSTTSTDADDADIYVISAGPIVGVEGLTPGIDINAFIRRHIIENPERAYRDTTLVIDASTALYKNLRLDPGVKSWVEAGIVSILIHESHQKFGLLHTDQAQYGRVFGICSRYLFDAAKLTALQEQSKIDFNAHVDMRIGVFISVTCSDTLEEIKKQHFLNGKLLGCKNSALNLQEDMLANTDEYYFFCIPSRVFEETTARSCEQRDSFGHYATTASKIGLQIRISANASDLIDTLIQGAKLIVSLTYAITEAQKFVIQHAHTIEPLSLEYQICCMAMLHYIADYNIPSVLQKELENVYDDLEKSLDELDAGLSEDMQDVVAERNARKIREKFIEPIELLVAMDKILKQCGLLKGRQSYAMVERYLTQLRQDIINKYHPKHVTHFFKALHSLYEHRTEFTRDLVSQLASDQTLVQEESKWTHGFFQSSPTQAPNPQPARPSCT